MVRVKDGLFKDQTGRVKEVDASEGIVKIEADGTVLELEADNVEKI
jgi:transcription antitermination factor NusG